MRTKKRKSLKKTLLSQMIIYVAIIIVIITQISIKLASDNIQSLMNGILARESAKYASEIQGWWSDIKTRVGQTADVMRNIPELSYDAVSELEFDSNMREMAAVSLYDTGVTASYGDRLLTLSTCDYQEKNGRFVVVAKKVAKKE